MTMLGKRAGLSKPALYRYFPNKRAILIELARSIFEENRILITEGLANPKQGHEKEALVAAFTAYCDLHVREPYRGHLRAAMATDPELVLLDLADSERNSKLAVEIFQPLFPHAEPAELQRRMLILMNQMEPFAKLVASRPQEEWSGLIESYAEMCLSALVACSQKPSL